MKTPEIISETNDWIAVNKPSGLLSIPDREGKEISLKKILLDKYKNIFTVHRLDKETSGVIVFAKNEKAHRHLSIQFVPKDSFGEKGGIEKIYVGFVMGSLLANKGTIDVGIMEHPIKKGLMVVHKKGKSSVTDYEVLEDFGIYSWMQFQIHTGRTHQVRVHMKHIGHPIVCDPLYGDGKPVFLSSFKHNYNLSKNAEEERPLLDRLALHAFRLKFQDENKNLVELEAPLPRDLKAVLQQLQKWKK